MPQPPRSGSRQGKQRPSPGSLEHTAMGLLRDIKFHLTDPREVHEVRTTYDALEIGEAHAPREYVARLRRALNAHEDRHRERIGTPRHHIALLTGRRPASEDPPPRLPRLSDFTDATTRGES
jgi:hypothetical protein